MNHWNHWARNDAKNSGTDEDIHELVVATDSTLEVATHLASLILGQYSDPKAIAQADALTMDIAGRQRMLSQQMSKDVCILTTGLVEEGTIEQLTKDVGIYQASLMALRNGMPEVGVLPPSTDVMAAELDAVIAEWDSFQPILATVIADGTITPEEQVTFFKKMNGLTDKMEAIVCSYVE